MSYYQDNKDDLLHYQKLYNNIYHDEYKQYQKEYYLKRKSDPVQYKKMVDAAKAAYDIKSHKKHLKKRMKQQIIKQKKLKQKLLTEIIWKTELIENTVTIIIIPKKLIDNAFKGYKMTNKGNYYLEW
jgi:hypothetical protein